MPRYISALIVLLAAALTAGVASARPARIASHHKPDTFYLIAGVTTDPFYLSMYRGAQAEARRLGARVVFTGAPDAFSASSQIPYVNLAIEQHASAILIAPADRTAMNGPLRRAARAGIPVITLDTGTTAPLAVTHISSRNVRGGELAARVLAHAIHVHGSVLGVSIRRGISTTDQREEGFARELRNYPRIQDLGTEYDDDVVARAAHLTAVQLARHPSLAGIFATNALSGDGVVSAVIRAHKARQVKVVEFDTEPLQVWTLRRGFIDALIAQDPWTMGKLGIAIAERWVSGHRAGIKKQYFTREAVITRANVGDPGLRRFIYGSDVTTRNRGR